MFGDGKVTWLDQISVKVVKIFIRSNRNPFWKMAMQRETIIFSCMSRTRSFLYCVNTFDHKNKPLIDDHLNLEKLPRTKKIEFFTSYLEIDFIQKCFKNCCSSLRTNFLLLIRMAASEIKLKTLSFLSLIRNYESASYVL